ncbi:hypothetical protein [Nocardia sp. NPDC058497]|uniref:hypothetical protein n=1 Tax=Nocardia sp. NPDC058497 TaxID=3346529 RepID=UPI00365F86ED
MTLRLGKFELWFPLRQVSVIAEHAMAAPEHSWPEWDDDKPDPIPPALVWAKDQGTYLSSNGIPRLPADPAEPEGSSHAVYAVGYDSHFDFSDTAVGGDDFAEYISLTADHGGTPLIEMIRHHAARGGILIMSVYPRRQLQSRVQFGCFTIRLIATGTRRPNQTWRSTRLPARRRRTQHRSIVTSPADGRRLRGA